MKDPTTSTVLLLVSLFLFICSSYAAGPIVPIGRACSTPATSVFPFCNTSLPVEERVRNLVSLLNATDKPSLLTARLEYSVPRLGIPEYSWGANCIHGIRALCGTECATIFPNPNGLGASFNMSLVYDMSQIIGIELRSLWLQGVQEDDFNDPHVGVDCWSPTINVNRDPRWGRNLEVAGEDPFLLSQYAIAYTKGLQEGQDSRYIQVVVTLKHWAAYSLENWMGYERYSFDAIVSEYDFANTYSVAFKAGLDAGARGVMCSYNAVNGVPACANAFLNNTLRGEWGFDGYVTSDTDAVGNIYNAHHYVSTGAEASALAMLAGTDINSGDTYLQNLGLALNQSLITMAAIDEALYRTFLLRFQLGLFDPIDDQPYWHVPPSAVNTNESQRFNLFATQQTLVLLQNDHDVLPFSKGKTVAVLGPIANDVVTILGNYNGIPCLSGDFTCIPSIYDSIQAANVGGKTVYVQGCDVNTNNTSGFAAAIAAASQSDYVVLVLGLDGSIESEGLDRVEIGFPGVQDQFSQALIKLGKPTVVVLINGGAIAIEYLKTSPAAVLEAFYPGFQGGPAIASAIFGDYNPGGKLPYTVYYSDYINEVDFTSMSMTQSPGRTYRYFTGTPLFPFGWGLSYTKFNLTNTNPTIHMNKNIEEALFTVNVTNVGKVAGDEVVQIFMKPQDDPYIIKQLIGFQRVHVEVGRTESVVFNITAQNLQIADKKGKMTTSEFYFIEITNGVHETYEIQLQLRDNKMMFL